MMKGFVSILFAVAIFWPLPSFCISHIGGGKVQSLSMGVVGQLPAPYFGNISELSDNGVYAASLLGGFSNRFQSLSVFIYELPDKFPDISHLDQTQLHEWMLKSDWEKSDLKANCMDIYTRVKGTSKEWALSWGPGLGFYIVSSVNRQMDQELKRFIYSLKLDEGACQWK